MQSALLWTRLAFAFASFLCMLFYSVDGNNVNQMRSAASAVGAAELGKQQRQTGREADSHRRGGGDGSGTQTGWQARQAGGSQ